MKGIVAVDGIVLRTCRLALSGLVPKRKSVARITCLMVACSVLSVPAQAELSITQTTAQLSQARGWLASGTAGNLVYFAGGSAGGYSSVVDMYDASTGTWSSSLRGEVAPLTQARTQLSAASANGRVFFAGGVGAGHPWESKVVDVFNDAGARIAQTSITGTPYAGRYVMAAAAANGQVFFAGGGTHWSQDWMGISADYVDEFDALTLSHTTMNLSMPRENLMGAGVGHKVLFAGGVSVPLGGNFGITRSRVDIYDTLLGTWSNAELSLPRAEGAAASLTGEAIFAGGTWVEADGHTWHLTSAVDIFNAQTDVWTTASLSEARRGLAGVGLGDLAFFAGGYLEGNTFSDVVDIYDSSTGLWSVLHLSEPRAWLSGAVVGNQVIFAGGAGSNGYSDTVDIFTIKPVPVPGALLLAGLGVGLAHRGLRRRRML